MGFMYHHDDYNERVEDKERKSNSCFERLDRGEAINGGRGNSFCFFFLPFLLFFFS